MKELVGIIAIVVSVLCIAFGSYKAITTEVSSSNTENKECSQHYHEQHHGHGEHSRGIEWNEMDNKHGNHDNSNCIIDNRISTEQVYVQSNKPSCNNNNQNINEQKLHRS